MTDWLTQLKTGLKAITLPLARKYWPGPSSEDEPYYNYRYQHVEQVERDARRLLKAYGGDEDIVLASVWIHDQYQPQFEGENHGPRAAEWAEKNLSKTGFPADKVPAVVYAVSKHSNPPHTIPESAKEARLLWDADKMGKTGALWVVYLLSSAPAFPQQRVDFPWVVREMRLWDGPSGGLKDILYFPLSQEIAQERNCAFKAFCEALEKETGD
jgi:predicted metal-dependent HD superfamily phosphohydrolase